MQAAYCPSLLLISTILLLLLLLYINSNMMDVTPLRQAEIIYFVAHCHSFVLCWPNENGK